MIVFKNIKQAKKLLSDYENKEIIHKNICNIIFDSIDKLTNNIYLFYYEKENLYHILNKEQYIITLRISLKFFEENENYEFCEQILKYINIIKNEI